MKKAPFLTVLSLAGLLALSSVYAAPLPGTVLLAPGSTVAPGLTADPAGTLLASLSAPFTTTISSTTGTLTSAVFRNDSGTLDFYYQLTNSPLSLDSIVRTTDANFTGFTTFAGYRLDGLSLPGGFAAGAVIPLAADRSLSGSVAGFTFGPLPANALLPGLTSAVMVISTDATEFTTGTVSVIDGGVATVSAFAPIPEPASISLLAIGLTAAGLVSWRARRRSA